MQVQILPSQFNRIECGKQAEKEKRMKETIELLSKLGDEQLTAFMFYAFLDFVTLWIFFVLVALGVRALLSHMKVKKKANPPNPTRFHQGG